MADQTVVILSDNGKWVKKSTVYGALDAMVSRTQSMKKVLIYRYECTEDQVSVDEYGGIHFPINTSLGDPIEIVLTDKHKKELCKLEILLDDAYVLQEDIVSEISVLVD